MGTKKDRQLLILIFILLVTGFLAYQYDDSTVIKKSKGLQDILYAVKGYEKIEEVLVADYLIDTLKLDDISQKRYWQDGKPIDLYAGYYFSIDKLSAAHSPLVCMPGQGWVLKNLQEKSLSFAGHTVNYAEVIAQQGEIELFVMYWFQAYDKSAPNMYINIYNALLNAIQKRPPEHAFVRISVPVNSGQEIKAEQRGIDFVKRFYPIFLDYIKE